MKKIKADKLFEKLFYEPLQGIITIILFVVFSMMPMQIASWVGGKIALILSPILPQNKRALQNLKLIFPHYNDIKIKEILKEAVENLGRNAGEYPHLGKFNDRIEIHGLDNIHKKDEPFIFVAAHLANWELTPFPGIILNRPVMRVYRKLNAPISEWLLRKRPSPLPGPVIPKGREGALKMLSTLRSGGVVLLLSDQRLNTGIKINFMGHPANTLTSPALMALKFGCPIYPLQIVRKKGCQFKIIIHKKIKINKQESTDRLTIKVMQEINDIISNWIYENPGQWFWHHRRWKI